MSKGMASFGVVLGLLCAVLSAPARAKTTVTIYLTDAQGTPVVETDAQGAVIKQAAYRPYGAQVLGMAEHGPGYSGHVEDTDTGLVYMQARYYDPEVGRVLSPDPIALTSGSVFNFNRYDYANNNPILNTDPTGESPDNPDSMCEPGFPCNVTGAPGSGHGMQDFGVDVSDGGQQQTSNSGDGQGSGNSANSSAPSSPSPATSTASQMARQLSPTRLPAKFVIVKTLNEGTFSYYFYQLEGSRGVAITGSGYSWKEHITPDITINGNHLPFVPMTKGVAIDVVGWVPPVKPPRIADYITTQTFVVRYQGVDYHLTSEFRHENKAYNGLITNTVTVIKP